MIEFSKYIKRNNFIDNILKIFSSIFFFSARKIFSSKSQSSIIVVISLHKLGDTVFTIPAIKLLLNKYGNKIIIYCFPESKNIYEIVLHDVKYKIVNKKEFKLSSRIASFKARKLLKELNPETIVDLTGSITTASLIFNAKAKRIIGFNISYFQKIYTDFTIKRNLPHLIDMYVDVVRQLFPIKDKDFDREYPVQFDGKAPIVIYPYAGWSAKEWDLEKYIELGKVLNKNYTCLFINNNLLTKDVSMKLKENNISILQSRTIDDLISILKNCSLIISNDSGPIYIANILNKPTFTIYGPTNPLYSLPYGKYHGMIQKEIKCSPEPNKQYCYTNGGLYCPAFECMNQLSFEEVKNSILKFIDEIGIKEKK